MSSTETITYPEDFKTSGYTSSITIDALSGFNIATTLNPLLKELWRPLCNKCSSVQSFCAKLFPEIYLKWEHEMDENTAVSIETKVLLVILYVLITLMSLTGNSLVIMTFVFDRHMRSVTNVFILSLAVADIMVTLTCVPINIGTAFAKYWIFGHFGCKLVPFFMTFSVACSSLTLCSIALDRYVAIVHPHKLKFLQNPKRAAIFLVLIWTVSFLCSVPHAVFYTVQKIEDKCFRSDDHMLICLWPKNEYKLPLELWLTVVVLFIIPLIIMSTTYGLIGYQLWIRKPVGTRRNSLRNSSMKKSVIKMLVIVMLAFIICWSPIMILNAVEKCVEKVNSNNNKHVRYLELYFQCLCMASCCINPIIYTFMNRKFREKFVRYLCCNKNRLSNQIHVSHENRSVTITEKITQRMSHGNIAPRSE
ncbi:hypothetical protein ACF0H5_003377 [Mactra antiquata]